MEHTGKLFFKLVADTECHNGYSYTTGLNIFPGQLDISTNFESEIVDSDDATNGFYFTDIENVFDLFTNQKYKYLCKVILPVNDPEFKIVCNSEKNIWRSNRILIEDAFELSSINTFKYLHLIGADLNNRKFIDWLTWNQNLDILKYLVENNFFRKNYLITIIEKSALKGNLYAIEFVNMLWPDLEPSGCTYQFAAFFGHVSILQYLFGLGKKPDMCNLNYALKWASVKGHLSTVKYLLENGADPNSFDDASVIAAAKNGFCDILRLFIDSGIDIHKNNDELFRIASQYGHLKIVKLLYHESTDIHAENDYALRFAAANGHLEVVEFLHAKGARLDAGHNYALRWACKNGYFAIISYLVENGVRIDNRVIMFAVRNQKYDVVKFLFEHMHSDK